MKNILFILILFLNVLIVLSSISLAVCPPNDPPEKPEKPQGPVRAQYRYNYTYSTRTMDKNGDMIYYNFSWGDGNYSGWLGPYENRKRVWAEYSWSEPGQYEVKVKAKDQHNNTYLILSYDESDWSDPLLVNVTVEEPPNQAPEAPSIVGPFRGNIRDIIMYNFTSFDPNGDMIRYYIEFEEGEGYWTDDFYLSGEIIERGWRWSEQGTYIIKAKVRDEFGLESELTTFEVSMPKSKNITPFGTIIVFGFDVDVKIVQLEPGEDYVDLEVLSKPFYIWENGIETRNTGEFIRLYTAKGLFSPSISFCFGTCDDWGIIG